MVLRLDDSVIQVAPTLRDVEAILIVRTLRHDPITGTPRVDGSVRRIVTVGGRKTRTKLPQQELEDIVETHIGPFERGMPRYETRSYFTVGTSQTMDRKVEFGVRWYGEDYRYLELRLRVLANVSDLVANRGMGQFMGTEGLNFLTQFKRNEWVEMHFDNHAHVGVSLIVRTDRDEFNVWSPALSEPNELRTRFEKILG